MLNKISFEKKLGIDSSDKKWRGMKVFTVSFLVCATGALLAFFGLGKIGYWVVVCGFFGCAIGMIMHFNAMFSSHAKSKR